MLFTLLACSPSSSTVAEAEEGAPGWVELACSVDVSGDARNARVATPVGAGPPPPIVAWLEQGDGASWHTAETLSWTVDGLELRGTDGNTTDCVVYVWE